jgi:UDP-glucose 4-epimerase
MRVLVTGASGFVGNATVAALSAAGHGIVATSTTGLPSADTTEGTKWIHWRSDKTLIPDLNYADFDSVVHLAAPRGRKNFPESVDALYRTNVSSALEFAKKAAEFEFHFIYASTGDVFATGPVTALEKSSHFAPQNFYSASKATAETLLSCFNDIASISVLRLFHPYGIGGDQFLINRLVNKVLAGEDIEVEGPNGILLNPVWIDDLAKGITNAVHTGAQGTFHLAGSETLALTDLISLMGEICDRTPNLRSNDNTPPGGHAGDITEAALQLSYAPEVNLKDGLSRLIALKRK